MWAWRSLARQLGKKKKCTPGTLRGRDPRQAKGLLDSCQLLQAPLSVPSAPSEVLELQRVHAFTAPSTTLGKFPFPSLLLCSCKSSLCSHSFCHPPPASARSGHRQLDTPPKWHPWVMELSLRAQESQTPGCRVHWSRRTLELLGALLLNQENSY